MAHTFDPARLGSLTSPRRHEAVKPLELLRRAGLQAGEQLLDWGCGAGFFTLPAAALAGPTGGVVGVDFQPEMVAATRDAVVRAGLGNVRVLATDAGGLPPGLPAFDWVLLAYILHEVHAPRLLLQQALESLKPEGRLLIVEWPKIEGPHGPPLAERLAPADLAVFYEPLGLRTVQSWEEPPEYYALVLQPKEVAKEVKKS